MKILSIDTSSLICSVCISEDDNILLEKHIENELTHSQKLMPLVDEILKEANLTLKDFSLFSCCIGPRFLYWSSNWCFYYKSIQ